MIRIRFVMLGAAALVLGTCLSAGCDRSGQHSPRAKSSSVPRVSIGIQTSPAMALVMVAKDRGCFEAEGIEVELKPFTAGKFALQAFLGGSIDFAVAGEVPTTLALAHGNKLHIISQVVERTTNEVRVVARRDETAGTPARFFGTKTRRLATSIGGGPEFYTDSFLKHYGIDRRKVKIISQKPSDMPAALASGSVDAIAVFDPFAYLAEKQLGQKAVTFSDPKLYSELYVLVCSGKDLNQRPEILSALLRGLARASKLVREDPASAKAIVVKYTKLEPDVVEGIWKNFVFAPALNEQLVKYMNDQAEWARAKGDLPPSTRWVDPREGAIASKLLSAVDPNSVKLR